MLVLFHHFERLPTLLLLKPTDDCKGGLRGPGSILPQYCTVAFVSFGDLGSVQTLSPNQWPSGVPGSLPLDFFSWTRSTACASSFWMDCFFFDNFILPEKRNFVSFFFVFF